jgi:excinuclease ABC subunit C
MSKERKEPIHYRKLRARLERAPTQPGVYRWLDRKGEVLYIGKAKNLRNRLRSYLLPAKSTMAGLPAEAQRTKAGPWKRALLERIADFDYTVTENELEALMLETNFIKAEKPKFNVLLKDDKNYVSVALTLSEPYPRVLLIRRLEDLREGYENVKVFGPFTSGRDVRWILNLLHDVIGFRACDRSLETLNRGKTTSLKPCIEQQIGRCNGLCAGRLTQEEYQKRIEGVARFFRGDRSEVNARLRTMMEKASLNKKFEQAARLRDALVFLQSLDEQQIVTHAMGEDTDAVGLAILQGRTQVCLLKERDGKVIAELSFSLQGSAEDPGTILSQFLPQYYSSTQDLPSRIVCGAEPMDRGLLEEWLSERRGRKVTFHIPERGKKSKLLRMAEENAREKLNQQFARWEAESAKVEQALQELQEVLELPEPPHRIEGYDISHLSGTETVGSMAVFLHGKPKNDHYRSFTLRTMRKGEIDDYKALREVLTRRLRHLRQLEGEWRERGVTLSIAKKAELQTIEDILVSSEQSFKGDLKARECIVARRGHRIVGCGRLVIRGGGIHLIQSLWIDDGERGQKLGHAILQKLLHRIKKGRFYVTIHPALEEYYAQAGFRYVQAPPMAIQEEIAHAKERDPHFPPEGRIVMMTDAAANKPDSSFSCRPDLLVLDGGKGQLGVGVEVLKKMNLHIPVISLAKEHEEVFVPRQEDRLAHRSLLAGRSLGEGLGEAGLLLLRLRDEAHRFANRHRERRVKRAMVTM